MSAKPEHPSSFKQEYQPPSCSSGSETASLPVGPPSNQVVAVPIVGAPFQSQAFIAKFMGLPHAFSSLTYMTYPSKKKYVQPKHLRKRYKRGKRPEEPEEEEVNPDLFKFKVEDPKAPKNETTKKTTFLGSIETSDLKMPSLPTQARRSHYTTVLLVRKGDQFSCVYGDPLKTIWKEEHIMHDETKMSLHGHISKWR